METVNKVKIDKEYLESLKKWYADDETVIELIDALLNSINEKEKKN